MKLLEEFEKAISQVGDVKRVWMTTFNLNIELVETYLLPLILHASGLEKKPRTRMDYEAMQQVLGEKNIDVRVFCDKRFVELNQNKRTALPVHTVVPERLASNESIKLTKDSLFHPKVIYIEGSKGGQIGAGSANLTISGWARNREVFSFVPVDDGSLAASIRSFFEPLFSYVGEVFPQDFSVPSAASQTPVFCHSLAGKPFLDQLIDEKGGPLAVWSPYFPRDLNGFVKALLKERCSSVCLVPDLVQNQYIRTEWCEDLKRLCEEQQLGFFRNPLTSGTDSDDQCAMTHAKLWKTPLRRAVGSWNFTQPGSNLVEGQDKNCNVEAGLIFHDSDTHLEAYLGERLKVNESHFASQALLDEESLMVPPTPPFDIQVFFDWSHSTYSVKGIWLGSEKPQPLTLTLPDLADELVLNWHAENPEGEVSLEYKTVKVSEVQALLKQRGYTARLDENQYGGLIIELHTSYRRAQEYPGLKELFDAFELSGGNPSEDSAPYRVKDEDEQQEADESLMATSVEPESKQDQLSYFRMFSFSQHYAQTLQSVKDLQSLDRWVRIRPGCLLELHKKVKARIEAEQPTLFNWFLVQEVNQLVAKASDRNKKLKGEAKGSLAQCLRNLQIKLPSLPKELSGNYQEWLEEEYSKSISGDAK